MMRRGARVEGEGSGHNQRAELELKSLVSLNICKPKAG